MVGYDAVENLAKRARNEPQYPAHSAIALGAYEVTPSKCRAYTIFVIKSERAGEPDPRPPGQRAVFPHARAKPGAGSSRGYLMVNLMQEVLRSGTGANVRTAGFLLPAAGKTGNSDMTAGSWGFTSEAHLRVWVGFDDNRPLDLRGRSRRCPSGPSS